MIMEEEKLILLENRIIYIQDLLNQYETLDDNIINSLKEELHQMSETIKEYQ